MRREARRANLPFLAFLGVLGAVALVTPILVARHYGALGIPRGDDWSYLQTLFRFAEHGDLDGNHWVSMTLLGQILTSLPIVGVFGHDITAVQIGAAVTGFGGLLATLWLGVPMIGRPRAALVVLTLALGPLWGPLAVSYMTDVPAFAATMVALALAAAALRRAPPSLPLLGAGLVAGVFAFSIRQYAIVAVIAIVVTAIVVAALGVAGAAVDRRRLRIIVVMSIVSVVACGVIYALWNEIPNLKIYSPTVPNGHSIAVTIIKGGGFVRLVGLLLLPVVALAGPVTIVRRAWNSSRWATAFVGGGLLASLAVLSVRVPGQQFVGNYVDANGALSSDVLLGHRPDLFPPSVYVGLVILATVSGVLIAISAVAPALELIARARRRDVRILSPARCCLGFAMWGYGAAYVFAMMTGVSVYDRYAFPLLPLIGIALLQPAPVSLTVADRGFEAKTGLRMLCGAALVLLAAVGLVFTVDAASFDGTRWRVAVAASHQGFARREINGGFEWVNFYRGSRVPHIVVGAADGRSIPKTKVADYCVSLYVDPVPDTRRVVASRPYTGLTRSDAKIVALRNRCRER